MKALVRWERNNPSGGLSVISVLHWQNDYREVYRYFRGIGIKHMNFLLPDCTRDTRTFSENESRTRYGEALADIFCEWLKEDDPRVSVRQIRERLKHFKVGAGRRQSFGGRRQLDYQVLIIHSDGKLSFSDSYIPARDWYDSLPEYSISDISLARYLSEPTFNTIDALMFGLPSECKMCKWQGICQGGDIENRFSNRNGFDNPSVYCDDYKVFCEKMVDLLISNGYPKEALDGILAEADNAALN